MYLSELTAAVEALLRFARQSFVDTVYRSCDGTLIVLYGAFPPVRGIYFSTTHRLFFPVRDITAFPRGEITHLEAALRKYIGGKPLLDAMVDAVRGRVVAVRFGMLTLVIPLFAGKAVHLRDEEGSVIWKEHANTDLPPLSAPLGDKEPRLADPLAWQGRFLAEERERRQQEERKRKEEKRRILTERLVRMRAERQEAAARAARHRTDAELIKAWIYTLPAQERRATVTITTPEETEKTIVLDPARTIAENMTAFFAEAKRIHRGIKTLEQRIAETEREVAMLEESPPPVLRTEDETKRRGITGIKRRLPYRRFRSPSGRLFLVGKSAVDNDELTFRISSPHDLWFHAEGHAGSHVILRKGKGETATEEEVFLGCCLALFYSKARDSMEGEVWYTERKFVRKKKGMPPGMVLVTQGKSKYLQSDTSFFSKLTREDAG